MQARADLSKRMVVSAEFVLLLSLLLEVCGCMGCSKSPRLKEIGCCVMACRGTEVGNLSLAFMGGWG